MHKGVAGSLVVPIASFFLAIVVSGLIMAVCGYNPFSAYGIIIEGALGSFRGIGNSLVQATPLIITGLAYMIAKKATMINLGVEVSVHRCNGRGVGWYDGSACLFRHAHNPCYRGCHDDRRTRRTFIGYLKVQFGSNEVITTTMTNFILINFTSYLANYPLKAEGDRTDEANA